MIRFVNKRRSETARVLDGEQLKGALGGGLQPAQVQPIGMEGEDRSVPPPMIPVPETHKLPPGMTDGSGKPGERTAP